MNEMIIGAAMLEESITTRLGIADGDGTIAEGEGVIENKPLGVTVVARVPDVEVDNEASVLADAVADTDETLPTLALVKPVEDNVGDLLSEALEVGVPVKVKLDDSDALAVAVSNSVEFAVYDDDEVSLTDDAVEPDSL